MKGCRWDLTVSSQSCWSCPPLHCVIGGGIMLRETVEVVPGEASLLGDPVLVGRVCCHGTAPAFPWGPAACWGP